MDLPSRALFHTLSPARFVNSRKVGHTLAFQFGLSLFGPFKVHFNLDLIWIERPCYACPRSSHKKCRLRGRRHNGNDSPTEAPYSLGTVKYSLFFDDQNTCPVSLLGTWTSKRNWRRQRMWRQGLGLSPFAQADRFKLNGYKSYIK